MIGFRRGVFLREYHLRYYRNQGVCIEGRRKPYPLVTFQSLGWNLWPSLSYGRDISDGLERRVHTARRARNYLSFRWNVSAQKLDKSALSMGSPSTWKTRPKRDLWIFEIFPKASTICSCRISCSCLAFRSCLVFFSPTTVQIYRP